MVLLHSRRRQAVKKSNMLRYAILLGCLALAGCNTVEGAGRDVQSAGKAVGDAAQDSK